MKKPIKPILTGAMLLGLGVMSGCSGQQVTLYGVYQSSDEKTNQNGLQNPIETPVGDLEMTMYGVSVTDEIN